VIDWVLAEKLAAYVAGEGSAALPDADLGTLAAESERRVTDYTGLRPDAPLPGPEGISRREWVASNLSAMRAMLDPLLARAGKGMGPLRPAMQIGIGITLTAELGLVVGYLAQRVLGQYELVLLEEVEDRPPRLLFVLPNLGQAVESFDADEREFVTWVALHEVTHAVQFAGVPWLHGHLSGLLKSLLASAELRLDDRGRRLRLPTREEAARVFSTLRRGDLVSLVATPAEREKLDQVQATMAVIEGHAEHVMDAVAPDLLPSLPRLRAALDRRRRTQSALGRLVARLLGLDLKLRQYELGKRFCDAIAGERGIEFLNRVWEQPESLPTTAELEAPDRWAARVEDERAAA
jgi:coenzyme F420 biosynthesis associated uncharacterized protein